MAPRTTRSNAPRNLVTRRLLITLARHVVLAVVSEALLTLLGISPWLRIAVEVATLAIAWKRRAS